MRDTLTPFLSEAELPRAGGLRRSLFVGAFVALVTLALVVPPAAVGSSVADDGPEIVPGEDADAFPLVGELTFHDDDGERLSDGEVQLIGVIPDLQLAAFWDRTDRRFRLVDTRTLEHLDVIDLPAAVYQGVVDPRKAVIDTEHHRVFLPVSVKSPAAGEEDIHECGGFHGGAICQFDVGAELQQAILTVSLVGEHAPVVTPLDMQLAPEESLLPTEIPTKLAYYAPTDRVYAVTESNVDNPATGLASVGSPYTTLHEFRAEDLLAGSDNDRAAAVWSYQLDTCEQTVTKYGGFLARSPRHGFVYLPCEAGTRATLGDTNLVQPALHGGLRIDLHVDPADPSDTSGFEERFQPFGANLSSGSVAGDVANDRMFFVGSSAGKNRVFTYDVVQEAWTGASALPEAGDVLRPTANPNTGRIYQWTNGGSFRVMEGDRVEVPNGKDYDLGVLHNGGVGFDPSTRRLFVAGAKMCLERVDDGSCATPESKVPHFRVFEDRLPDAPPPEPYDFDQDTEDVSGIDGPVFSSAATNAKGFGARYLFVGGTQSGRLSEPFGTQREVFVEHSPVGPSARDVVRAEVDEASLTRFTGTPTVVASATGLRFGQQTGSDIKSNTQLASEEQDPTGLASGRDWPEEFPEDMRGYQAYCDDFGGDPSEDANTGAAVSCDSLGLVGQAGALYTATDEQAPVQVGYAETSVEVREDDTSGAVAKATAVARDIELFGQISIGEIRTEATAVAHGRPGTAATELTRQYRQVRVGDGFACGWGEDDPCDIWEVAGAINDAMQPRVVASVPAQDTTLNPDASDEPDDQPGKARVSNGTPAGAKSGVTLDPYDARSNEVMNQDRRMELPGLQIVYYDDHQHVSRHIFQFAAVNLDTYYTVSSAPTFDPPDWADGGGGFGGDDGFGDGDGSGDFGGAATRRVTPPSIVALGEEPVAPAEEPELNSGGSAPPDGDTDGFAADDGTSGLEQGQAPSLGTAEGPALDAGQDAPVPEVAPDASSDDQAVAQGEQGGASGPGGLMLTRQRMGQTVPLAVLWVMAALPFYLAVRRRRLLTSSTR